MIQAVEEQYPNRKYLTPRHYRMTSRIVVLFCKSVFRSGYRVTPDDQDELVGEANYVLLRACDLFDPTRNPKGWGGFTNYLYTSVHNQVRRHYYSRNSCRREAGLVSLDHLIYSEGVEQPSYHDRGPELVDAREAAGHYLSFVPPREQEAVRVIHCEGGTYRQAGHALGVSKTRSDFMARHGMYIMQLAAGINPPEKVEQFGNYLIDHPRRLIIGTDCHVISLAYQVMAARPRTVCNAVWEALVGGAATLVELSERLAAGSKTVRGNLKKLADEGLVRRSRKKRYFLTDAGRRSALRTVSLDSASGYEARKLQKQGYRTIAAREYGRLLPPLGGAV